MVQKAQILSHVSSQVLLALPKGADVNQSYQFFNGYHPIWQDILLSVSQLAQSQEYHSIFRLSVELVASL